ncbi:hypothetical protein [Planotetraspora mira]|uniref:hypothetical protein n=1 Tax=Planotetraspora mira TaxID=58121 RepID=UPI00194F99A7|nr:hypothetical protein [Planotetraspora mira]
MRQRIARGTRELGHLLTDVVIGLATPFLLVLTLISAPTSLVGAWASRSSSSPSC